MSVTLKKVSVRLLWVISVGVIKRRSMSVLWVITVGGIKKGQCQTLMGHISVGGIKKVNVRLI